MATDPWRRLWAGVGVALSILLGGAALYAQAPSPSPSPKKAGTIHFHLRGSQMVQRGDVAYNHARHLARGYNCKECHPRTFKMKRGRTPINMHLINSGQLCGKCHNGSTAFKTAGHCNSCHSRIGRQNIYFRGVIFQHATHGAPGPSGGRRGFTCDSCHDKIFKMKRGGTAFNMDSIRAGRACGTCHNGVAAFSPQSCMRCHNNPGQIMGPTVRYKASTLGDVRFSHGNHVLRKRLDCEACHPRPFQMAAWRSGFTMDDISRGRACGTCHNGRRAFSANACSACHGKVGPNGGFGAQGLVTRKPKGRGVITFSHKKHIPGRTCNSCHGKASIGFKMKAGATPIAMSDIFAGKSCGTCHNQHKAFGTGDCLRCHQGMEPPADITWKGESMPKVVFSHGNHVGMGAKCAECHSGTFKPKKNGNKIEMDLINAGKQCGQCHNGKRAFDPSDCTKCHQEEAAPSPAPAPSPSAAPSASPSPKASGSATVAPSPKPAAKPPPRTGPPDIVLPEDSMGAVTYSHTVHLGKGYKCTECHSGRFKMKAGADKITMDDIKAGKFCGACHDGKKAFNTDDCTKCHKQPG